MLAVNRLLTTFILLCCTSIFTSSIDVEDSGYGYIDSLSGIPDRLPRLYAMEMQFRFCITCWQMIGDPEAAMDRGLRLWLGHTDDGTDSTPDDEYIAYVIDYVRNAVQALVERSYDGAGIPRELHRPECNRLVLESVPSFLETKPNGIPDLRPEDHERVLRLLAEKLPENEASFNCNWVFEILGD